MIRPDIVGFQHCLLLGVVQLMQDDTSSIARGKKISLDLYNMITLNVILH